LLQKLGFLLFLFQVLKVIMFQGLLAEGVSVKPLSADIRGKPSKPWFSGHYKDFNTTNVRCGSLLSPQQCGEICGEEMARTSKNLTAVDVKSRTKIGRHADGDGLYLNIAKGGSKSWVFLWMKDGTRREMGLGSYPTISLADARTKVEECRKIVAAGGNAIAMRNVEQPKTFGEAADEFISSMEGGWRNDKHGDQWRMTLGDAYCKSIRSKSVEEVNTDDVLKILTPIWQTKAETASRLRGRIERVIDYAKVKGWRQGENPALWRGHLKGALPTRQKLQRGHHAEQWANKALPAFIERLQGAEAMSARALEFLILTAARSGEMLGANWPEFDMDAALWTVPADRMKAGKEHRVPLSDRALALVKALHEARVSDYVFPGEKKGRPLSGMAFAMLMRRMKVGAFTPHGFRSAFRDWCGDETTFQREVAEAALAHEAGNKVEAAYHRSDALKKRRNLMVAWERYCLKPKQNNILNMPARA
jgi:integrase